MPLIAMNREMGSLGKDVAAGLEQALGMKVRHHEIIDHLANRARMRKSHVVSFLEGTQGLIERLTTDQVRLRILTADEILSMAESDEPVILRGWGATSLLKEVPHAVRVCVSASRRTRVQRMMERLDTDDQEQVERIVDQNDEAARAVMRRHFHIEPRDINEYDMGFNTDRVSVDAVRGRDRQDGEVAAVRRDRRIARQAARRRARAPRARRAAHAQLDRRTARCA